MVTDFLGGYLDYYAFELVCWNEYSLNFKSCRGAVPDMQAEIRIIQYANSMSEYSHKKNLAYVAMKINMASDFYA